MGKGYSPERLSLRRIEILFLRVAPVYRRVLNDVRFRGGGISILLYRTIATESTIINNKQNAITDTAIVLAYVTRNGEEWQRFLTQTKDDGEAERAEREVR